MENRHVEKEHAEDDDDGEDHPDDANGFFVSFVEHSGLSFV